jgi:hypothetical protein
MRVGGGFENLYDLFLINQIEESAARSMIDYSELPGLKEQSSRRIKSLFNLTTEKLIEPIPLPTAITDWYRACSLLNALPERVPPAPCRMAKILDRKCPIHSDQKQEDTHILSLIPEEFGTVNRFESDILRPYGEANYPEGENPLRFRHFWDDARQEHADVPFAPTHWVLMTKDVLPGSRSKSWDEQAALVNKLSRKALVDYEVPTLQQMFTAIATHKVATGESLYQAGNERNGNVYTSTCVKETTENYHLVVGGSAPSGVFVHNVYVYGKESLGVAALRKFR